MDNRLGVGTAAASVPLSDQVVAMPRLCASGDKHRLSVPRSLPFPSSLTPKDRFIFRTSTVCHLESVSSLFLSPPEARTHPFFSVSLPSLPLQLSELDLTFALSLVIRIHSGVLKESVSIDWLGVRELSIKFLFCI